MIGGKIAIAIGVVSAVAVGAKNRQLGRAEAARDRALEDLGGWKQSTAQWMAAAEGYSDTARQWESAYEAAEEKRKDTEALLGEIQEARERITRENSELRSSIQELRRDNQTVDDYLSQPIPDALRGCLLAHDCRAASGASGTAEPAPD